MLWYKRKKQQTNKTLTLRWPLFLLAAFLPGRRSKENLEFRTFKSTTTEMVTIKITHSKGCWVVRTYVCVSTNLTPCLGEKRRVLQRCDVWSGSGLGATGWMGLTCISASFLRHWSLFLIMDCMEFSFSVTMEICDWKRKEQKVCSEVHCGYSVMQGLSVFGVSPEAAE